MKGSSVWLLCSDQSYDGLIYEGRVFSSKEDAERALQFTPADWEYYKLIEEKVE